MTTKQTNKKSFLLYQDQKEVVESLTDKQAGRLFKAIFKYSGGEKPELSPNLKVVFIPIRQALDRFRENYEKVCKVNKKNITKRWKQARKGTKVYDRIRTNTNRKDSDSDIKQQQAIDELVKRLGSKVVVKGGKLYSKTRTGERLINNPEAYLSTLKENRPGTGGGLMDEFMEGLK